MTCPRGVNLRVVHYTYVLAWAIRPSPLLDTLTAAPAFRTRTKTRILGSEAAMHQVVRSTLPALCQLSGDADVRVALAAVDALGEVARAAGAEGPALQRLHAHLDALLGSGRHEARPRGANSGLRRGKKQGTCDVCAAKRAARSRADMRT